MPTAASDAGKANPKAPSRFKWSHVPKVVTLLLAAAFAIVCFRNQAPAVFHPCNCIDAYAYVTIADLYVKKGTIAYHQWSSLRTYGYPGLIAGVLQLALALSLPILPALAVFQVLMYFAGVVWIYRLLLARFGSLAGEVAFYSLVGNVFLYPCLVIPLTDGFSVILLVVIVAMLLQASNWDLATHPLRRIATWALLLGGVVGFAVMVRPANLFYLGIVFVASCVLIFTSAPKRVLTILVAGATFLSGFFLVVAPQIIFNQQSRRRKSLHELLEPVVRRRFVGIRLVSQAADERDQDGPLARLLRVRFRLSLLLHLRLASRLPATAVSLQSFYRLLGSGRLPRAVVHSLLR